MSHKLCPECDSWDTKKVFVDWWDNCVKVSRLCNECSTEWTVDYGDPYIEEVSK